MAINKQSECAPFDKETADLVGELVGYVDRDISDFEIAAKALNASYSKGRSDCLQEIADLKKPLLPHELKLIARLLDLASDSYSNHGCNDFDLEDTARMRGLIRAMHIANNPETPKDEITESMHVHNGKLNIPDWWLMAYPADRVREMLTEEES